MRKLTVLFVAAALMVGMCSGIADAGPRCHGGKCGGAGLFQGGILSRIFHRGSRQQDQDEQAGFVVTGQPACATCGQSPSTGFYTNAPAVQTGALQTSYRPRRLCRRSAGKELIREMNEAAGSKGLAALCCASN